MTKQEFLKKLEKKLEILSIEEREDTINEYRDIIDEKMKHGKTEEEAVKEAGDVDELAKEIIEAYKINTDYKKNNKSFAEGAEEAIGHICEDEHCDCEHGIFKSALKHTINILIFIVIITFILNTIIYFVGEETIANALASVPFIGILLIALVGFIPNCAGSVIITELYLSNLISLGAMMAGLLVGSGIGILVLFKSNKHIKQNFAIVGILYAVGVISGLLIDLII